MARIVKDADERRRELVTCAQKFFYTKGYEQTSITDIVTDIGVAKGTFYYYFDSKQAVLEEVVDTLVEQGSNLIKPIVDNQNLSAIEKFIHMSRTANQWKIEQRDQIMALSKVLYGDNNLRLRYRLITKSQEMTKPVWIEIIKQGVAENMFNLDGVAEDNVAEFILAILRNSGETFIELLLAAEQPANTADVVTAKYVDAQKTIERMLNAPTGSLPLIDTDDMSAWFA